MTQLTFTEALGREKPLLIPGVINAYCAKMAGHCGFNALYLSGGGVAATLGLPDLAATTMDEVATECGRITAVTDLPLLVDIDTGFGTWLNMQRTVKTLSRLGVAAVHLEDQVAAKRCGHRPNKQIVATAEMVDRIRAAVDARPNPDFFIMARTDALASEPMAAVIDRLQCYVEAGADGVFLEAAKSLEDYRQVKSAIACPILANITEFGATPMLTAAQLHEAAVDMMLFPLSAFRAMNQAALMVYQSIRANGHQHEVVDTMQTRAELYEFLGYQDIEDKMDKLF